MTVENILSLIAGNLLGIAICAVGIVLSLRLTQKEKTASRLYLALFALLLCLSVSGMLYALSEGPAGASAEPLYRLGTFLAQGCNALYYLSLTCLLLLFCGETDWKTNTLFRVSAALCVLGLLLTPVAAFSKLHFFFDFSRELQHTQAYLAVEQARFPDLIVLEYDTPHTAFTLPALTLQPLVENAVKHGFDPDRGPLHILIRTRALDTGSELTVEDDGSGFSGPEDAEAHFALDNIRSRLAMNGGTLTIAPRAAGGTVVTVVTVREAVKN